MNKTRIISTLKFIAAAVIIIAAGLIVFPALISFALGTTRLLLWVVLVLLVANGLRYLWNVVCAKRRAASGAAKNKSLNDLTKKSLMIIAVLHMMCTVSAVQAQGADTSLIIPAGTIFEGRIDTKIGSTTSHAGQRFHIVVASPVLANGTTVLIPAGARVLGEVVEAIPANHIHHAKGMMKPKGKLRVQLTALEMPSGAILPMVASLAGEYIGNAQRRSDNPNLGHGVGYIGSSAGFNQVTPQSQYASNGRTLKPQLVSRDQMLKDPLYGVNQPQAGGYGGRPVYRELRQHGRDIEIENDSPLSVKLDAALKIPFEEITQSVHGGKGLPSALGLEQNRPKEPRHVHKSSKPAGEPIQYKQEQPGASFVPGVVPGIAPGAQGNAENAPPAQGNAEGSVPAAPPRANSSASPPPSSDGDAGF